MQNNSDSVYKTNSQYTPIQSCVLSIKDLLELFEILSKKALEVTEAEILNLPQLPDKTPKEIDEAQKYIRDILKLNVQLVGTKGEIVISQNKSIFDENNIPKDLRLVVFENSYNFNFNMKKMPNNYFEVRIDFTKPPVFDLSTSPDNPTLNNSYIKVTGNNETWVTGVYQIIVAFFKDKKTNRNRIHSKNTYLLFLYVLMFPFTFWSLFRIDIHLQPAIFNISKILLVALYTYVFFVILLIYRLLFNYARWMFPPIEFVRNNESKMSKHRRILLGIIVSLALAFLYDFLRFIFIR